MGLYPASGGNVRRNAPSCATRRDVLGSVSPAPARRGNGCRGRQVAPIPLDAAALLAERERAADFEEDRTRQRRLDEEQVGAGQARFFPILLTHATGDDDDRGRRIEARSKLARERRTRKSARRKYEVGDRHVAG